MRGLAEPARELADPAMDQRLDAVVARIHKKALPVEARRGDRLRHVFHAGARVPRPQACRHEAQLGGKAGKAGVDWGVDFGVDFGVDLMARRHRRGGVSV
jgi:hypothetical protein